MAMARLPPESQLGCLKMRRSLPQKSTKKRLVLPQKPASNCRLYRYFTGHSHLRI
jgi:hypothetical protein